MKRLSPGGWIGLGLVGLFVLAAIFGPWFAPHSPSVGNLDDRLLDATSAHLLGTDENGVDLFSAMLYGARTALLISLATVTICAVIGVGLGTTAGYFGGAWEELIMRIIDVLLAFPGILLNLAIVAVVKRPGLGVVIFALTINGWVGYARVARSQVLSMREREFVIAARALGASPWRVITRHIVPNILSPLLVQMTVAFGGIILVEASLSFLGVGPQVNYSWGALLEQGTGHLWRAMLPGHGLGHLWHTQRLATVPGLAIMLVVLGFNLLGDALRDRMDPKS